MMTVPPYAVAYVVQIAVAFSADCEFHQYFGCAAVQYFGLKKYSTNPIITNTRRLNLVDSRTNQILMREGSTLPSVQLSGLAAFSPQPRYQLMHILKDMAV